MAGGRLDLVVEDMPIPIDRLAGDRRFETGGRLVDLDRESTVESVLRLASGRSTRSARRASGRRAFRRPARPTRSRRLAHPARLATMVSKSPAAAVSNRSDRSRPDTRRPRSAVCSKVSAVSHRLDPRSPIPLRRPCRVTSERLNSYRSSVARNSTRFAGSGRLDMVEVGQAAPDFSLPDQYGRDSDALRLQGITAVVLISIPRMTRPVAPRRPAPSATPSRLREAGRADPGRQPG